MTKADVAALVKENSPLTAKDSAALVELIFETMKETLGKGEDIKLAGFGNFTLKSKEARKGRNPQTGKEMQIPAKTALTFKPGLALKNAINPPA